MTTSAQPAQATEEPAKNAAPRTRSPAYPSLNLKNALEKAKIVWEHEKRNPSPIEALAADWGLNVKSSATLLAVSSLKKFGLLEELDGTKDRLLKLSTVALNIILNEQEDSVERTSLLKQCALTPKIHADLWSQYGGELPSDASLKRHLIVDRAFNPAAVDGLIRQFKETIAFAKLVPSDKITIPNVESDEPEEGQQVTEVQRKTGQVFNQLAAKLFAQANVSASMSVVREFNFPLPSGVATLKVPHPLTEEDFQALLRTLGIFKEGLVKKADPVAVSEEDPDWQQQVRSLVDLGFEVNLSGFDYSHDISFVTEVAKENKLDLRFDLNKGIAQFRKRQEPANLS